MLTITIPMGKFEDYYVSDVIRDWDILEKVLSFLTR